MKRIKVTKVEEVIVDVYFRCQICKQTWSNTYRIRKQPWIRAVCHSCGRGQRMKIEPILKRIEEFCDLTFKESSL